MALFEGSVRLLALPRRHGAAEARAHVASPAVYVNRINISR